MYKIGVIGTGNITSEFIESSCLDTRCEVVSVLSRDESTGEEFRCRHNLDAVYDDIEEFLNSEIDIVYIASPNSIHYEQAMLAIAHYKHVIIEKPMALNPIQISELFEFASQKNVLIIEAMVSLAYDSYNKIKTMIKEIGTITKASFNFMKKTRHYDKMMEGEYFNVFDLKMGGGAFYDLGIYLVYPMIDLFGVPNNVEYKTQRNKLYADLTTKAICEYDGFNVEINTSKVIEDDKKNIIIGTNGYIIIESMSYFQHIILYNINHEIVQEVNVIHEHRMLPELQHFLDTLDNNLFVSSIYTPKLAIEVSKVLFDLHKDQI